MSYTYVTMDVSKAVYEEVKTKLEAAGYHHAIHEERGEKYPLMDMHGIALRREDLKVEQRESNLVDALRSVVEYCRHRAEENEKRREKGAPSGSYREGWHAAKVDTYERCAERLEGLLKELSGVKKEGDAQ